MLCYKYMLYNYLCNFLFVALKQFPWENLSDNYFKIQKILQTTYRQPITVNI